jgi:hypothetical protein
MTGIAMDAIGFAGSALCDTPCGARGTLNHAIAAKTIAAVIANPAHAHTDDRRFD